MEMQNGSMDLSVIIPCRDGGKFIAHQLAALARQQWSRPWEVVVVDNGSVDDSRAIAERYRARLPRLRIVGAPDRHGIAHARNVGIAAAASDRFAFCDVDDEVGAGWVAAMGEALARHAFVGCRIDDQKLNPPRIRAMWDAPVEAWRRLPVILNFLPAAAGCGFGVTRRLYEKVGPFDESLVRLEDIDYAWRVQLAGERLHYLPHAVVHYRYADSLRRTYRQCFDDGLYEVALYKKYMHFGMRWRSWRAGARHALGLLYGMPTLALKGQRVRDHWVKSAGGLAGRIRGSIAHRVLAL